MHWESALYLEIYEKRKSSGLITGDWLFLWWQQVIWKKKKKRACGTAWSKCISILATRLNQFVLVGVHLDHCWSVGGCSLRPTLGCFYRLIPWCTKTQPSGWMVRSAVSSVYCSGRGPGFNCQDHAWQLTTICKTDALFWPQQASGVLVMSVHTCRQNTHEVKIDESSFKSKEPRPHPHCYLSSPCPRLLGPEGSCRKLNENLPFLEGLTRTCSSSHLWREVALSLQTVA